MKTTKKAVSITFGALLLSSFALIFFADKNVLTIGFLNASGEYLTGDPTKEFFAYQNLQQWIYFSQAGYLFVKIALVAMTIYTALYLNDAKCSFTDVILIVVQAEFIFVIAALVKALAFMCFFHPGTLMDWHRFHPLSALSIVSSVGATWYYPLQTLNLFEIAYWFTLAYGLHRANGETFDRSLRVILSSYVPALAVWTLTLSFFSVVMFPNHI